MPPTVLIVEDDDSTCAALAALLSSAGYQVLTATTFHGAKTILRAHTPDVMIVDIRLDGFNGLQLLIASGARVPAIVVSGFRDVTLVDQARKLGADFLEKPIEPSELLALLQRKVANT